MHQLALELQSLMVEVESAAPSSVEAVDGSGAVRMVIDGASLPETLEVSTDWRRRINADGVGDAVVDAYAACTRGRAEAMRRALESHGIQERLTRLESMGTGTSSPILSISEPMLPPEFRPAVTSVERPSLDLLAEEFLAVSATVNAAIERHAASPALDFRGSGQTRRRTVTITLSSDRLESCEVDPAWAEQQSGIRLSSALREALAQARDNLAAAADASASQIPADTIARLNEIFQEAVSVDLNDRP